MAVVAVAAVVVAVVRHGSAGPTRLASISEAAFVTRSAQRTLSERTAKVTLSGDVQAGGQTLAVTGSGEIDFSTGAAALTEQIGPGSGNQVVEKEIETNGNVYYTLTLNNLVNPVLMESGRHWIRVPVKVPSSANLTGNPGATLVLLEQHGNTVRVLGSKRIGGVHCTGYSVTPSRQAMLAAEQREAVKLKLSPAEISLARDIGSPTITIWLDAHGLLRQTSLTLQLGGPTGTAASASVVESFSDYGTPVHISAPASSDVISNQLFRQMAANANPS